MTHHVVKTLINIVQMTHSDQPKTAKTNLKQQVTKMAQQMLNL